ncbi:MAG TPA: hypothetical protein VIQ01_07955, partial [Burkholderiales bacterium]
MVTLYHHVVKRGDTLMNDIAASGSCRMSRRVSDQHASSCRSTGARHLMNTEAPQPLRQLINTRTEYLAALDALLPLARNAIRIFDPDLVMPDLNSSARIEQLRTFLRADRNNTLHIALHDVSHVVRNAVRLIKLLQDFPTAIVIYRTEGEALRAQDRFVLIDAQHFVRRPVAQQGRGVYALHEPHEGAQ